VVLFDPIQCTLLHREIQIRVVSTGHCNTTSGQMTATKGGLHGIGTILEADT
jgi:hypothetical protein